MYKAIIQDKTFIITGKHHEIVDGQNLNIDILEYSKGRFHILFDDKSYSAEILSLDKENKSCEVKIGNKILNVVLKDQYDEVLREMGIDQSAGKKVNDIKAPMPGMVLQIMVEDGQSIKKGDAILILEAMKMENILKSPADGIIRKIMVMKGDKVEKNQVMIDLH
jgi:biotin carboxyl carrier protein